MPSGIILLSVQYRLSRVYSAGVDLQSYNKIILFNKDYTSGNAYFVEGFNAHEFVVESYRGNWHFRKETLSPVMKFDFNRFKVIGNQIYPPFITSRLSLTPTPCGFKINEEHDVFSGKFKLVDASTGDTINTYNSTDQGSNNNFEFYDRNVRSIFGQRNILNEREIINSTNKPEAITEQILEAC